MSKGVGEIRSEHERIKALEDLEEDTGSAPLAFPAQFSGSGYPGFAALTVNSLFWAGSADEKGLTPNNGTIGQGAGSSAKGRAVTARISGR